MSIFRRKYKNEEELISGCLRGERAAQKALYDAYSSRMYPLCIRYTGAADDAKDVLQEGFITLFDKLSDYAGRGSFDGWVRRIFVNTALMHLRKRDLLKISADISAASGEMANEDILDSISAGELNKIIASMPAGFRTVFNMYIIEGYSHEEIAKHLGITESSSRSQLTRARAWLKSRLEEIK